MTTVDIYAHASFTANEWVPSPVSKQSPVLGYDMSLADFLILRHYANLYIYAAGTKKLITMNNIKEYFPEYNDGSSGDSGSGQTSPSSGTLDYNELMNKPQINGVTLTGNKTDTEIGIANLTDVQLDDLLKLS